MVSYVNAKSITVGLAIAIQLLFLRQNNMMQVQLLMQLSFYFPDPHLEIGGADTGLIASSSRLPQLLRFPFKFLTCRIQIALSYSTQHSTANML